MLDRSDPWVPFSQPLRDAVRDRVVQDTIRQAHLTCSSHTLTTIVSALTPNDEGGQNENIESIVWGNGGSTVDVSDFLARSRLSRLRCLDLNGQIRISSWDHLASRSTLLTTLSLNVHVPSSSPTVTVAQLFSILTSNPNIRKLSLSEAALPNDADRSTFKVQLCNLKALALAGEPHCISGLLCQLILPEMLDGMDLRGSGSTVEDMPQILTPYMQDHFRRDVRFQERLMVSSSSRDHLISIVACTQATPPGAQEPPGVTLRASTWRSLNTPEQFLINLFALIPWERVVSLDANLDTKLPEELLFMAPNVEALYITDLRLTLSEGFLRANPDGPPANTKLLPSLEVFHLRGMST